MKRIQGIIFDYDGTLADSMRLWNQVDDIYIERHGIKTDIDVGYAVRNLTFRECADFFIREFSLSLSPEEIMAEWNAIALESYKTSIPLKEGVREFLEHAKRDGIKMCIVTSNHILNVEENLRLHKIDSYFSEIITADGAGFNKTQPELFRYAVNKMGLSPEDCVLFDDIFVAISAAKEAGLYTVGVADVMTSSEDTEKIKETAHFYIDSFIKAEEEYDRITRKTVC